MLLVTKQKGFPALKNLPQQSQEVSAWALGLSWINSNKHSN